MKKAVKILILNLPSPENQILWRDTAGGYGTSLHYPSSLKGKGTTPLHPFLPYAASALRAAEIDFEIVDCQREQYSNWQAVEVANKINPDIIVSILSLPSMSNDLKVLGEISKLLENVTTIGVGTICKVTPEEVFSKGRIDILLGNNYPYIDGLVEVIETLSKKKSLKTISGLSFIEDGRVVNTLDLPEFDFEKLPNPDYSSLSLDGYDTFSDQFGRRKPYVLIVDSKGCPYGCSYCAYPLGYGRKFTFRDPIKIVDEMAYLNHSRDISVFAFKGQSFAYNKLHAQKVCDEIKSRGLKITWFCESRVDEVNDQYLTKMKNAGCERIHYGVETGDPNLIKTAKPGINLDTTRKAFKITKMKGIATQAHVVLGWPDDTLETMENTRKFLLEINPDALNLNFLTPYPGTAISKIAEKESLLLTRNWSSFTSHTVVMRTKSLSAHQLYAIKQKITRDFSIKKIEDLLKNFDAKTFCNFKYSTARARYLINKALFPVID